METRILEELQDVLANDDAFAEKHHTFINDCLAVLTDATATPEDKQATLLVFMSILRMHVDSTRHDESA